MMPSFKLKTVGGWIHASQRLYFGLLLHAAQFYLINAVLSLFSDEVTFFSSLSTLNNGEKNVGKRDRTHLYK